MLCVCASSQSYTHSRLDTCHKQIERTLHQVVIDTRGQILCRQGRQRVPHECRSVAVVHRREPELAVCNRKKKKRRSQSPALDRSKGHQFEPESQPKTNTWPCDPAIGWRENTRISQHTVHALFLATRETHKSEEERTRKKYLVTHSSYRSTACGLRHSSRSLRS